MTTINSTITTGGQPQWQAALNASTSITIKNNAAPEQLIVSATGATGPLNGVIIDTALTIDNAGTIQAFFRHSLTAPYRYLEGTRGRVLRLCIRDLTVSTGASSSCSNPGRLDARRCGSTA
jgi:hypothetical protein